MFTFYCYINLNKTRTFWIFVFQVYPPMIAALLKPIKTYNPWLAVLRVISEITEFYKNVPQKHPLVLLSYQLC